MINKMLKGNMDNNTPKIIALVSILVFLLFFYSRLKPDFNVSEVNSELGVSEENQKAHSGFLVIMNDQEYSPNPITAIPDMPVIWINRDSKDHTVSGDNFDSGIIPAGGVYSVTFSNTGVYSYHSSIDDGMQGSIIVQ